MVKQCIEAVEQFDESHLTQITTEVNQVLGKNKPHTLILPVVFLTRTIYS